MNLHRPNYLIWAFFVGMGHPGAVPSRNSKSQQTSCWLFLTRFYQLSPAENTSKRNGKKLRASSQSTISKWVLLLLVASEPEHRISTQTDHLWNLKQEKDAMKFHISTAPPGFTASTFAIMCRTCGLKLLICAELGQTQINLWLKNTIPAMCIWVAPWPSALFLQAEKVSGCSPLLSALHLYSLANMSRWHVWMLSAHRSNASLGTNCSLPLAFDSGTSCCSGVEVFVFTTYTT